MPKVKNVFGETRFVPWIGRDIADGEVVDVPDDELAGYLEGGWEPADKATKAAQAKLWADGKVTVGKPEPKPQPKPEPEPEPEPEQGTEA